MSHTFHIGEIALVFAPGTPRHGEEVEIIDLPQSRLYRCSAGTWTAAGKYTVLWRGQHREIEPRFLRKRRPPQDWVKLCKLTNLGETGPAESPGCSTQELRSDVEVAARTGRVLSTTVEHCAGGRSALAARDWRFHV